MLMSPSCHKSWSTKYHFSADAQVAIAASKVITSAFIWQLTIWLSSSNVNTHCACFTKNGVKKNCGLPHENLKKKNWKVRVLKNGEMKWKTRDFGVGENKEKQVQGEWHHFSRKSSQLPPSNFPKKKNDRPFEGHTELHQKSPHQVLISSPTDSLEVNSKPFSKTWAKRKKNGVPYFPLNPGWLIKILIMACYNPCMIG